MNVSPAEIRSDEGSTFVYLSPAVSAEKMLANMRSSIARGLPLATICKPHNHIMSIAGGGPSLADTYKDLSGFIATVNGSLKWVIDHEIKDGASYACGIMDAGEHIADMIVANQNVRYYVASICDPKVFDKLKGCDVRIWHVTPESTEYPVGVEKLLDESYPFQWRAIGGGCTMGLRWLDLGYFLGFRRFHLHGMDSSFRGNSTHAYPDRADGKDWMEFSGRWTRPNFLAQVEDFGAMLHRFWAEDCNIEIEVYGDGLLQDEWKAFRESNPDAFRHQPTSAEAADLRAAAILRRLPDGPVIGAEVGVFAGALSSRLLRRPGLSLYMIDSWEGGGAAYLDKTDWHAGLTQDLQNAFAQTAKDVTEFAAARRCIVRDRSVYGAADADNASLDFVFLDADHSYEGCKADIEIWARKVKRGGWLCGHDYGNHKFPGVKRAVDEVFGYSVEADVDGTWFHKC